MTKSIPYILFYGILIVALNAQDIQFSVHADAPKGIAPEDGRLTLFAKVSSWQPSEQSYVFSAAVRDWSGREHVVATDPFQLRLGRTVKDLPLTLDEYGPFFIEAVLKDAASGEVVESTELRVIRLIPAPELTPEQRLQSPIGLNVHHGVDWNLMARMGVHWVRDYSWGWLGTAEKAPLAVNGTDFRAKLTRATQAGVYVLPCMRDTLRDEEKGFMDPDVVKAAYRSLGDAFPEIPYWELENEYEHQLQKNNLDSLEIWGPFIEAAHAGLSQSKSDGKIVLNGTAGILNDDTVELLDSDYAADFSVVNYHYYTGQSPPELAVSNMNVGVDPELNRYAFVDHLREINRLAKAHGKKAWFTELGWDVTYGPAVGIRNQARYLPRMYVLSLWAGTDKLFWFFDRDSGKKRIFGSSGLFDIDGNMRPSGAAMAALSAHVSTAKVVGRVDLSSPDIWCVLMEKPGGGYVVPVWSVEGDHALPSEFGQARGFDIYGNETKGLAISGDIQYFHFAEVPTAWKEQAPVSLITPVRQPAFAGHALNIEVEFPSAQAPKLIWKTLPEDFIAGEWQSGSGKAFSEIKLPVGTAEGEYTLTLQAIGKSGWTKTWSITVIVLPPLTRGPVPYKTGEWVDMGFTANEGTEGAWRFSLDKAEGEVKPASLDLSSDEERMLSVYVKAASDGQSAPIEIKAIRDDGLAQFFSIPPAILQVPRRTGTDADLGSGSGSIPPEIFTYDDSDFSVTGKVLWSEQGLYWLLAMTGTPGDKPAVPENFWESESIEIMLNSRAGENWGWEDGTHQFFFVPVEGTDGWKLQGGEWKRNDAIQKSIFDDNRLQARLVDMDDEGYSVAIFIPAQVIGLERLKAGDKIGAAIARRHFKGSLRVMSDASWPVSKSELLSGAHYWGELSLID